MTKREKYHLNFSKLKMKGLSDSFICRGTININSSLQLANVLEILSDDDSVGLLDEINLA